MTIADRHDFNGCQTYLPGCYDTNSVKIADAFSSDQKVGELGKDDTEDLYGAVRISFLPSAARNQQLPLKSSFSVVRILIQQTIAYVHQVNCFLPFTDRIVASCFKWDFRPITEVKITFAQGSALLFLRHLRLGSWKLSGLPRLILKAEDSHCQCIQPRDR